MVMQVNSELLSKCHTPFNTVSERCGPAAGWPDNAGDISGPSVLVLAALAGEMKMFVPFIALISNKKPIWQELWGVFGKKCFPIGS